MPIASRTFFVDADDTLLFMSARDHALMFKHPEAHPVLRFAGMHVRTAEVLVEVQARAPTTVLSVNCYVTTFDERGVLVWEELVERFVRRPRSPSATAQDDSRWQPSSAQALAISNAALGHGSATRLLDRTTTR